MKAIPLALLPALFLTGCVGVIPVPRFSNKPVASSAIDPSQTDFIIVGETTRVEVVDRLGSEFRDSPRLPALAYSWELPGGQGLWWLCSTHSGIGGEFEWSRWRAFFVAFDSKGVVTRTRFVHLSSRKSLDEQLEAWAVRSARSERRS